VIQFLLASDAFACSSLICLITFWSSISSGPLSFSSSWPSLLNSANCLLRRSTVNWRYSILRCSALMIFSSDSTSTSFFLSSAIRFASFSLSKSFYEQVFKLSIWTLEISFEMPSISTSLPLIFWKAILVCFNRLALLFSTVFWWLAWLMMSSRMSLVFVCSCIIDFSRIYILSSTLMRSLSMRPPSSSVWLSENLSIVNFSWRRFFSASISSLRC